MKQNQHITFNGPQTTPTDVCRWAQKLVRLHARIAPRFARAEPRRRALAYLHGIGVTDRLTLASLEQAAAALQARVDAL